MNQAHTSTGWLPILAIALAAFLLSSRGCHFSPATPGVPPEGPNMVRAFGANDNRAEAAAHALAMATIHDSVADMLEYDGKLETPRLKTGVQVDDFQRALREFRMRGWSFGYRYPDLRTELQLWFDAQVGDSGGAIDAPRRQKWIQAHRAAAASCRYAASRG